MVWIVDGSSVPPGGFVLHEQVFARLHRILLHPLQGAIAARGTAQQATNSQGDQHPPAHIELQGKIAE